MWGVYSLMWDTVYDNMCKVLKVKKNILSIKFDLFSLLYVLSAIQGW